MKKILALALGAAFVATAFTLWHSYRATAMSPASSSQIFIHGTPVCVFRQGEDIVARVGQCPSGFGQENDGPNESLPFHGHPGMRLPPGHPPVGPDMNRDAPRGALI